MLKATPTIELCVDDVEGVRIARNAGIDRVELCAALDVGGLTPDDTTITNALTQAPQGGLQIIVRSRPGDFVYTPEEITHMCDEIQRLRELTAQAPVTVGFVVGATTADGHIDTQAAAAYKHAAVERPLTFHRAFDCVKNQEEALDTLIELGYERVLTTGGDPSVAQHEQLARLSEHGRGQINIIASGGVRSSNVAQILRATGAPEVHMRAPHPQGGTDAEEVTRIVNAIRHAHHA